MGNILNAERNGALLTFPCNQLKGNNKDFGLKMRLWIIGNGFDLYHGLKTSYADYKAYLCQQNTCKSEHGRVRLEELPREVCRNCCKCETENCSCPVKKFNALPRKGMHEDLWSNLEEACSFDLDELLKRLDGYHTNVEGGTNESAAEILMHGCLDFAKDFTATCFTRWLREVENVLSGKGLKDQMVDIEKTDLFLTFNYTNTLKKIYDIPEDRVLHVHGSIAQVEEKNAERRKEGVISDEEGKIIDEGDIGRMFIAFGSPDLTDEAINVAVDRYVKSRRLDADYGEKLRHRLLILVGSLKKDVQTRLEAIRVFLGKYCKDLLSVDEVVVAGHSLDRIDGPYFDFLSDLFSRAKWRFLYYSDDDILKAFEFYEKYKLDGCCVPWGASKISILGGMPCPECDGAQSPGFSICWPRKR